MLDLNLDRWLESEADRRLMRERYTDEKFQHLMDTNPDAREGWDRIERGLPPQELACKFCPSMDAKDFDGVAVCKKCCEERDDLRICRECGEMEFINGPEGPTMCVWCRSIDSEYSPDWEDE
jgi:hypothetical protein